MTDTPQNENLVPDSFDTLTMVFLNKGPNHTQEDSPELEERHFGHLRNLKMMRETGKMILAGPTPDSPERYLRGLCLFYDVSREQIVEWMELDPQVKAGFFSYQVITWLVPGGSMKALGK